MDPSKYAYKFSSLLLAQENPYVKTDDSADSFWFRKDSIQRLNWDKSYPYQLIVVERVAEGQYREMQNFGKFTLPIPPESMAIDMPFAITTSLTLGGVIEEHNGAPMRMITFSGTTGVMPLRGTAQTLQSFGVAQSIFAGTINAATATANAALDAASSFTSGTNLTFPNVLKDSDVAGDDSIGKTSGYYQFRLLQNYLESYAHLKKKAAGKNARLAVAIWKDEAVYLVTPVTFSVRKAVPDALIYNYTLSFKAWRRVSLDFQAEPANAYVPIIRDPSALARTLKVLEDARRVLQGAQQTLHAIGGDVDASVFEPLRQSLYFVKDALGVSIAFGDLPVRILQDAKGVVLQYLSTKDGINNIRKNVSARLDQSAELADQLQELLAETGLAETGASEPSFKTTALSTSPANDPFTHPEDYSEVFNLLQPGQMNLTPTTVKAIIGERTKIRRLTRLDFQNMRDALQQTMADIADAVGAGDATYDDTFGRTPRTSSRAEPTDSDFDTLFALNDVVMELGKLAASGTIERGKISSVEFMGGLARRSGIAFTTPRSKFAVPFPYGSSLEQLAYRYLGDPDRWGEIAALNGLVEPWVDEEGFDLLLLTNGSGNEVQVADASQLYAGQQVWLSSPLTTRAMRRIVSIRKIAAAQFVVTVDGDPDLSRFTTVAGSTLHAFTPDTLNSQMLVYIPSDQEPADEDFLTKSVPGIDQFDPLIEAGGVDLLLTSDNDLAVTPDGDCRLAVGLTNIIQMARIRLSVVRGSLMRHPHFGLPVAPGMSTADMDATQLAKAAKDLFADSTYIGVKNVSVLKQGPLVNLGLTITVSGVKQPIPITVQVKGANRTQ